ncbi:hypothetical protein [Polaromonas naphthalenivorans]|uniref:Uncharacterized protein n=1 Tax=Polaromonas naphthalenivorans (strain CJ2) TaxID=365044 RepID=A1VVR5_POLNA|nr:hypothetical protein [Polaromonas naphthalenivorans]ABM39743.1 hypothetical protein Pnap_4467 [Polaromonas naphthalenivorans CJ2]
MKYRGYIARALDADEDMVSELHEFVARPSCLLTVREHVLEVLHEYEMTKRAVRTNAARRVAADALNEIENK